jgi:exosome complex RNA-binding protein Csl4
MVVNDMTHLRSNAYADKHASIEEPSPRKSRSRPVRDDQTMSTTPPSKKVKTQEHVSHVVKLRLEDADTPAMKKQSWKELLKVGQEVEAMDAKGVWCEAMIVNTEGSAIQVHFVGWEDKADEAIGEKSRIRTKAARLRDRTAKPSTTHLELGDIVKALDYTGEWYRLMAWHIFVHCPDARYATKVFCPRHKTNGKQSSSSLPRVFTVSGSE